MSIDGLQGNAQSQDTSSFLLYLGYPPHKYNRKGCGDFSASALYNRAAGTGVLERWGNGARSARGVALRFFLWRGD
jgi:hypothetical protein